MADKPKPKVDHEPASSERDEPVKIELDPEVALKALLKVDPDAPVPQDESLKDQC